MKIYVTLPIHNERDMIISAVTETKKILEKLGYPYLIILAEDASTDGSAEICAYIASREVNVIHIHSDIKKGRGNALKRVVASLPKDGIFVYLDADLSIHPKYIANALQKIKDGYDIVIGSRWKKGARVKRGIKRKIFSLGYNTLINLFFNTGILDHQCGFKVFNLHTCREILLSSKDDRWFWDTEVIIRAKWRGLQIFEMPVEWIESKRDSKVNIFKDTREMLLSAVKFRVETLLGGDSNKY